jgi:hypothetical protein
MVAFSPLFPHTPAVALSVDHKPSLREERLRIEDAGGVVVWAGTWRVSGVLAVSRAFGDRREPAGACLSLCSGRLAADGDAQASISPSRALSLPRHATATRPLKQFVIPTPHLREEVLGVRDDCVILASDGVWDVITNQVGRRRRAGALMASCFDLVGNVGALKFVVLSDALPRAACVNDRAPTRRRARCTLALLRRP